MPKNGHYAGTTKYLATNSEQWLQSKPALVPFALIPANCMSITAIKLEQCAACFASIAIDFSDRQKTIPNSSVAPLPI
jgi:hypothetical protein